MRNLFVILFLIVIQYVMVAEKYHTYNLELVATLPVGEEEGMIRIDVSSLEPGPTAFAFDREGNIYISDVLNRKLIKYDKNGKFIKEFPKTFSSNAQQLFINENGDIITYFESSFGFACEDSNGNKKFVIDLTSFLNEKERSYKFNLIYQNNTAYIKLRDGKYIAIKNPEIDSKKNKEKLMSHEMLLKSQTSNNGQNQSIVNGKQITIDEKDRLIMDGELLDRDYDSFIGFHKEKKKNIKDSNRNIIDKKKIDLPFDVSESRSMTYIGTDKDKNVYWRGTARLLFIFDKEGELLDVFKYDDKKSYVIPTIDYDGNIYTMNYDDKGVYIYRIKRVW